MITSLLEMLKLPNFVHMTLSTTKFGSHEKKFVGDLMDRNYDVITFISKYFHFKKAWGSQFPILRTSSKL